MIILKIWNALFSQDLNALRLLDLYWRGCSVSFYRMVVRPYRTTMYPSVGRPVRSCHELSWGNVFIEGNTLIWIVRKSEFKVLNYVKNFITVVPVSLFYLNLTDSILSEFTGRLIKTYNMKYCISLREKILHYANPWSGSRQIQFSDSGSSTAVF